MSIQSEITRIASAKSDIADAIEDKGVTVPTGTKIDGMATLIGQISSGSGSAVTITETTDPVHGGTIVEVTGVDLSSDTVRADKLATGYTAHNASGSAIVGTMASTAPPIASITVETAVTTTTGMVALLTDNISEWELNQLYFVSIEGNTATGQYKGLSCSIVRHSGGLYYGFLRTANLTSMVSDSYRFDISVGATVDIYKVENAIYPDPLKRITIRPDAQFVQSWTYDKRIVADEGVTIPAWTTTQQILKSSGPIGAITPDSGNYNYFIAARSLVIPEYNTTDAGRGRFEWSSMVATHELVYTPNTELLPLVNGTYTVASGTAAIQGGVSYRGLYFTSSTAASIYSSTSYGIWTSYAAPTFASGEIRITNPSFVIRGQANILDQPFWEALTDIRFQYVIELWRVPIDSLGYRGWQNQQSVDHSLACLYSSNHKLT